MDHKILAQEGRNKIGLSLSGYGSDFVQGQVPCQPAMAAINARLSKLNELLQETYHPLVECGDRLLGPIPRGVPGVPGGSAEMPSGVVAETLARLDDLISMTANILGEAQRLNGNI